MRNSIESGWHIKYAHTFTITSSCPWDLKLEAHEVGGDLILNLLCQKCFQMTVGMNKQKNKGNSSEANKLSLDECSVRQATILHNNMKYRH